ncbi:mitochondrial carrier homolog 2 isoform X2 [Manis javanica]|uniref:mitochondrial carrier homolog 2 isoform X2 n=1 Tax=Manis javanica TaxID=9974 RepID=UPI00187A1907|nr:mitochondrial carrier homolog 2 isoform X2 [Manis javanica]
MADAASQVILGSGLTILSQPLMYVKVLIQVGYEPLPPNIGRNIFGRQVCQLPGLFCYARHIASIDGKRGLFRGLTPRLCSGVLGTVVHGKVLQHYQECDKVEELGPGIVQKEASSSFDRVIKETTQEMMARSAAALITHPFHVITLRSMVQFIGRESKYCGLFDSIVTIYQEEGILGFFAGLIPRLLGDIISLWLCNSLAYLVNTYALDSGVSTMNEMKSYSQAVTGFFASMLTYPFVLVSNLMAVNNCGLAGGSPPYSPIYTSWVDCWCMLQKEKVTSSFSFLMMLLESLLVTSYLIMQTEVNTGFLQWLTTPHVTPSGMLTYTGEEKNHVKEVNFNSSIKLLFTQAF